MDRKFAIKLLLFLTACVSLTFGIHAVLQNLIIGFDFPYIWHPGRALFFQGINPYSTEVAQSIFFSEFHRAPMETERMLYFMYPVFILFLPLPLFVLHMDWAAAAWMAFNITAVISIIPLLFSRFPTWLGLTLILFYEVWFTIFIGNFALLIFLFLSAAFCLLLFQKRGNFATDVLCGAALAWTAGKPQMVWVLIPALLMISLRLKRTGVLVGFFASFSALMLVSFLLLPNWMQNWVQILLSWPEFNPGHKSILMAFLYLFFPRSLVWGITMGVLILSAAFLVYSSTQWWKGRFPLIVFIGFCILVQNLFDLSGTAPDRLVLIIPILLYVASHPSTLKAHMIWLSALLISNLLFVISVTGVVRFAGDYYTILFYLAFLAFLVWENRREIFPINRNKEAFSAGVGVV